MAERCFMCGRAATAGGNPHITHRAKCIRCASLTHIEIPMSGERMGQVPDSILEGPAWPLAAGIARGKFLWLHQAEGLSELDAGQNIVVATSTASGKTMIFQLWTMNEILTNPGATALIFYPTKALANDQARRWQETCRAVGLNPETVGQIDGDVQGNDRDTIINRARIIIATPDVTHAWMLRRTNDHSIRRFLQNLRVIVIDEAHTYEGIFGSNAAYLMRRLTSASLVCGAAEAPRFIAATATIQTPDEHLEKLTGRCFSIIGEERNGSPRFHRDLYHMPMSSGRTSAEDQLAQLVLGIIDNDDEAQVIAFHDSRMGVERIVQRINRKESVLPYRSGYLAQDRRAMEEKLRNNTIRGVIATSALELGIDMPDLNYGIQLNLPPSRKQFHQRLGRVGRSQPGVFVLLARQNQFSNYGETLQDYYDNSVEPSHLYLDNEYINYQQALCLKDELERNRRDTRTPPSHITWPSLFPDSLRNAHGRPPRHLQNPSMMGDTPPQIANSLRSCGEETLQIIILEEGQPERNIGQINIHAALNEAYPGGVYRHQGVSYHVVEWRRRRENRKGFIRVRELSGTAKRTDPMLRQMATLFHDPTMTMRRREMAAGDVTERRIMITESVEGFESNDGQRVRYRDESRKDPRLSRKQREIPTTAVQIRISKPWFAGGSGDPWQARHQIAQALRLHLGYQRSIALPDIGYRVENIFQETPQGFVELEDSILVHDNIHGGLGLVSDLQQNLDRYVRNLVADISGEPGTVYPQHVEAMIRWVEQEGRPSGEPPAPPGCERYWRIIRPGTEVSAYSPQRNEVVPGEVTGYEWRDRIIYLVDAGGETIEARDGELTPLKAPFNWLIWKPQENVLQELQGG